jgi:hypothetical protein
MAAKEPIKPKNEGLAESIINEGKAQGPADTGTAQKDPVKEPVADIKTEDLGPEKSELKAEKSELSENLGNKAPDFKEDPECPEFLAWKNLPIEDKKVFVEWLNEKNSPAQKAPAEKDPTEDLVKKYGANYVVAIKNGENRYFSRVTWDRMNGNKNQDGWREVVKTPPEVKALQKSE